MPAARRLLLLPVLVATISVAWAGGMDDLLAVEGRLVAQCVLTLGVQLCL